MLGRLSIVGCKDMSVEERKRALGAKNQLSKPDEEWSAIIEGFQFVDVAVGEVTFNKDPST